MDFLNWIGKEIEQNWKNHHTEMYEELQREGTLHATLLKEQERAEERLERVKDELLMNHPMTRKMDDLERFQHMYWIHNTAWELIRDEYIRGYNQI